MSSKAPKIGVRFNRDWRKWNKGEVAGFDAATAASLVKEGVADYWTAEADRKAGRSTRPPAADPALADARQAADQLRHTVDEVTEERDALAAELEQLRAEKEQREEADAKAAAAAKAEAEKAEKEKPKDPPDKKETASKGSAKK